MKELKVIYWYTDTPSFKWQNGYYVVLNENKETGETKLVRLDDNMRVTKYDNGLYVSYTGNLTHANHKKTDLFVKLPVELIK